MEKNKNFDEFIENDKKKLINLTQEDLLNIPIDVIQKQTKDLSAYTKQKTSGNPLGKNIGKENCFLEDDSEIEEWLKKIDSSISNKKENKKENKK